MFARISCIVVVLCCAGCQRAPRPPVAPPETLAQSSPAEPLDPERITRGSYVAALSGCVVCHSPMNDGVTDRARTNAGGLEVPMADGGRWRSPNITPDDKTGVGRWTDAQLVDAIREGVRPGGVRLLPVMPYPYYHRMTDADARAVVAYLRAQRPIENRVAPNEEVDLKPVSMSSATGNIDPVDDLQKHGEYLATLMHCGACHAPSLGGGTPFVVGDQTIYSPNITSDAGEGIGGWTEDDIIAAVRTMKRPDGTDIGPPMAMHGDDWARLTDRDARALAMYVKSVPPIRSAGGPTISSGP